MSLNKRAVAALLIAFVPLSPFADAGNNSSKDSRNDSDGQATVIETGSGAQMQRGFGSLRDRLGLRELESGVPDRALSDECVVVTQVYSLDHPAGIPDGLLVSNPTRLDKLIDGVKGPVCWVFPGPVSKLTANNRLLIGLPQRLGAMEIEVPADALKNPGGFKFIFSAFQKTLDVKDRDRTRKLADHKLDPLVFAALAAGINERGNELAERVALRADALKDVAASIRVSDIISGGLPAKYAVRILQGLSSKIQIPFYMLADGSVVVCVPTYHISDELMQELCGYLEGDVELPNCEDLVAANRKGRVPLGKQEGEQRSRFVERKSREKGG